MPPSSVYIFIPILTENPSSFMTGFLEINFGPFPSILPVWHSFYQSYVRLAIRKTVLFTFLRFPKIKKEPQLGSKLNDIMYCFRETLKAANI